MRARSSNPAPPSPRGISAASSLSLLTVFLFAFLSACEAIHFALSFPYAVPAVSEKLNYLSSHKEDFDAVFIGSSRVYYGFIPSLFDQAVSAGGRKLRAFNLGIEGLNPPEDLFVLKQVLAIQSGRLKWIFIEKSPFSARAPNQVRRRIYWRDWEDNRLVLGEIFQNGPAAWRTRVNRPLRRLVKKLPGFLAVRLGMMEEICAQESGFLFNQLNLGRGIDFLQDITNRESPAAWKILGPSQDGYFCYEHTMDPRELAGYRASIAKLSSSVKTNEDPVALSVWSEMAERARNAGAAPLFVIMPTGLPECYGLSPGSVNGAPALAFNDVRAYAPLYDPKARIDADHLSGYGAHLFTEELARLFLLISQAPGNQP